MLPAQRPPTCDCPSVPSNPNLPHQTAVAVTFFRVDWLLVLLGIIVGALVLARRPGSTTAPTKPRPAPRPSESLADVEARMLREVDDEAAPMMHQVEADAARLHAEAMGEAGIDSPAPFKAGPAPTPARGRTGGPSWMSAADWEGRLVAYRRQGRSDKEIAGVAAHLEKRGPRKPRQKSQGHRVPRRADGRVSGSGIDGAVYREDYVPKEDEARYLTRDGSGLPRLRLADAGDRLAIWSPVDGGSLINPKGPGLRGLGLYSSYARGIEYHASADRTADLRKGQWIDLKREPDNPHDKNAVAMYAPGARSAFAYVQRGRAPAVARRMDAGEDMAAVSMRGPAKGRADGTTFVLLGSRADLTAMLAR